VGNGAAGTDGRRRAARWAAWSAALAAAGGAALLFCSAAAWGPPWLAAAVRSRLFRLAGGVFLVCLAGLVPLGLVLRRAGAARRARSGGRPAAQDGAAIVEFALVLPIATMLVLVMIQSTLLMAGDLCVHYAAYCAARSAIVTVPDDLAPTEPPNVVVDPAASRKMRRIQLAAVWAVLPVSSSSPNVPLEDADILTRGLEDFFAAYGREAPGWVDGQLHRRLSYAEAYTGVSLAPPANGLAYGDHEDLRVTVRHVYYLSIPYASWVFGRLDEANAVELDFGDGERGLEITAACTLTNEGVQDYVEAERFPPQ